MGNDTDIASLQEKIDDLNQQAWEARVNDSPKSFELSQESVKLARSINYAKGLAEGLRSLGLGYVRFFKNEEAAPLLRESLSLFQSLNDLKGQGIIYEYLGIIERNFGNLGVSLELLLKGNDLVRQTGPLEVEVTSCYQVGVTYKHLGKHENALDYLYRSISLSKKINFTLMEAYATNIIGSIYFDNGDYNHALDCYQQSLVIRRQSHDKWGEAGSLDNIGFTYLKLNDLDKAIAHCKQSLQITQGTDDKKGEANALLHLAEIYQQAGDIGQASKFSNESFEIRKARGDKRGEAEVLLFLANLHKHENDVNDHQIFDWLSNALKIAEEIKAQDILSKACYNLHEYHTQKGNYKESLVHLEAHLQIEKELHKNTINQKISNLEISHKAETISQRNKELTELNEQIEKANEELKIERSLERVRTAAMAMKEPADMLEVCKIISDQLEVLDVKKIRNVQTAIFYEEKSSYMNYEYYAKHDKLLITEVDYNNHPVAEKFAKQMLKGPNQVWTHGFKGEEVKEWLNYQQSTNVFIDTYLETADSLNYYWYSLGPVALGMSTYAPLNENEIDLFKRFRNVFELAYRRYLDIEKAQAQAREAQIQLALERVRARTMAMQHSNELQETAVLLFQQIKSLNIPTGSCSFNIWDADEPVATVWSSSVEGDLQAPFKLSHTESPIYRDVYASMKRGDEVFVKNVGGEELKKHFVYLTTVPVISDVINKLKKSGYLFPESIIYHFAFFKQGYLSFHVHELQPEAKEVFVRFAKVFEQAYTRFLDLQKAEAQAREAKIEVALERARTQSMIMQHSNELDDTLRVFHEQVLLLGINSAFSFLWLPDEDKNRHIFWAAWAENVSIDPLEKKDTTVFNSKAINYPLDRNEPATAQCLIDWKGKEPVVSYHVPPDGVESYFATWQELISGVAQLKPEYFSNGLYYVEAFMKYGCFGVMVESELSEDEKKILLRFSIEFERTYTRFLDLQKSEAQARDAQIEVALERIRSKVMAMSSSKDLDETSLVFGEQLRKLGIDWQFSYFWLIDEAKNENTFWITWPDYKTSLTKYTLAEAEEYFSDCLVAWRGGVKIHDNYVPPSDVQPWLDTFQRIADDAGGVAKEVMQFKNFVNGVYYYDAMMRYGSFGVLYNRPSTDEEKNIQCRFAIEFERAYTRFLDLKNAEAQVREAQIQLALERVRARTMAMHSSKELDSIIKTVYSELKKLDVLFELCFIMIFDEHKGATWWMGSPDDDLFHEGFYVPYHTHPPHLAYLQGWEERQQKWEYWLGGQIKKDWDDFVFTKTELSKLPPIIIQAMKSYDAANLAASFESFGCMTIGGRQRLSEESFNILSRFAKVFDLSYTRFRDLQKAEAQAREAQIELGLERVRARAMAMQNSDELKELIGTVYTELTKLDLILDRCFILIYDNKSMGVTWWMSNPEAPLQPTGLFVKYHEQPPYLAFIKGWKERNLKWQYILEGEVKKTWDKFLFVETELSRLPEFVIANMKANEKVYLSASFNNFGCLTLATLESLSDAHFDILLRFAKVFDLTYTRFNDLKQAEAQAREARIETALEKIRASTMAMQRSEDLSQTAFVLFNQFKELGQAPERIFIATFDDHDKGVVDLWGTDQGGKQLNKLFKVPVNEPTMVSKIVAAWKDKKRSVVVDLKGEELKTYLGFLKQAGIPVTEGILDERRVQTAACFSNGVIGVTTSEPQSAEAVQLQERFAGVFDLTYTRFLDLQKAEAQTREALIEGALERVRARALAMQQPEELKDVAQVLRNEMGALGVEELETCSIYIHGDSSDNVECWYALQDPKHAEKKMVSDHFVLNLDDTWVGREMKKFYGSGKDQTSIVMQGMYRKEWIKYCYEHSPVFSGFYGESIPDRTYHLHKFSHGYIGAAAPGDISGESWKLLGRAASVFSLAYSRFKDLTQARNDLIKLKEEKKRAEDALTELQATQKQLIQSEKMASLGELTAGIAHEIQNPLNFVNNFSDVSNELLEEMKAELEKGNAEGAKAIAVDVKENLEKILHHGKRADAIVKGMLQHSRSSSGQKELTDINVLAEEYLRLAYHGLRAKDKFFNAKFETDLDRSITKINIIPQEIGRVILNLINNSFYAVSEKKKNSDNGYEPIVTVSTKAVKPPLGGLGVVEIRVMDNGNGIPKKVLDKIFQPFFTTKPTGVGTGLGLSLSYDIVTKGHSGEIKVETKEGEGSAFIISLPMK